MLRTKLMSAALAVGMLATAAAPVFAEAPASSGTSITIRTEVNGNGVITHSDGVNVTTDSYVVKEATAAVPTPAAEIASSAAAEAPVMAAETIKEAVKEEASQEEIFELSSADEKAETSPAPTSSPTESAAIVIKPADNMDTVNSMLKDTCLFKLIREYVYECMDMYNAEHSAAPVQ